MNWNIKIVISAFLLLSAAPQSYGQIYQWAYGNPSDPSQGVVQSSTLCPSGSGVSARTGAILAGSNLTQAYLIGAT